MEDNGIRPNEIVPASRKLSADKAKELVEQATRIIVCKGKSIKDSAQNKPTPTEIVKSMLGPTGNLRAPTLVSGKLVIVGYNEEVYGDNLS